MIWNNSSILWLLLLIPTLYVGWLLYKRIQKKRLEGYFDERLINKLRRNYWTTGDRVRLFSFLAALLFFIIALAGPKIGTEVREVQRQGVNLMVALDLSRSMNTQDVSPSRLNKAKLELNRLVNRLREIGSAWLSLPMRRLFRFPLPPTTLPSGCCSTSRIQDRCPAAAPISRQRWIAPSRASRHSTTRAEVQPMFFSLSLTERITIQTTDLPFRNWSIIT